ncbi:hypothetical protein [Vibrio coralliilyticus]|uniref:hypothetical protein n=1 Tax=Vibrio coralliilyticus TaxID=190893 RepID=UPI00117BE271|nr:hypothetical protein [Vibrio coralliilyticus]NOI60592.1 hypothetical protein [Vibrio coralliilyticus]
MNTQIINNNKTSLIIISFIIFAFSLSMRDVFFRHLLLDGNSLSVICFWTGFFGLVFSFFTVKRKEELILLKPKFQFLRLILNGFSCTMVVYIFTEMSPSTVSILTKSGMPLTILVGSFLGHKFFSKEIKLSYLIILCISTFAFLSLESDEKTSHIALIILFTSILLTVSEFLLLSKAVKDENKFYISSTPSLALLISGIIMSNGELNVILSIKFEVFILLFLCGLMFFMAYYTSIIRYKYLPPGLAEYPSLVTYFILLPIDLAFFNGNFDSFVFFNAVIILSLMSILVKVRVKG